MQIHHAQNQSSKHSEKSQSSCKKPSTQIASTCQTEAAPLAGPSTDGLQQSACLCCECASIDALTASQDVQQGELLCLLLLGQSQHSPFTGRQTAKACSSARLGINPLPSAGTNHWQQSTEVQTALCVGSKLTNSHQRCGAALCIRWQVQLQQGPAEVGCMGSHHGLNHQPDVGGQAPGLQVPQQCLHRGNPCVRCHCQVAVVPLQHHAGARTPRLQGALPAPAGST